MDREQGDKGRKAIKDNTYENDKRYKDPDNKVLATIAYIDTSFKRSKPKYINSTTMIFGKSGEAYITRDEKKSEDEQYLIFNYADKANYIVMPKDKTAMKMPLINMKKMVEKGAEKEAQRYKDQHAAPVATGEYATICGYRCRKIVTTGLRGEKSDMWVSKELKLNLGDNYMMGARLNSYKFPESTDPTMKEMAGGFVVRMVTYNDDGVATYTHTLTRFEKGKADESIFDMSRYKVNDVLGPLMEGR